MNNNEMTQKQNNDESYWHNFLDEDLIIEICNLDSDVKRIIKTLIIKNEDIKQYLDTIYKINDTETIQEILDVLTAVCNAFGKAITSENILERFEIYPEQRQEFFENGICNIPIITRKLRKNNGCIIQIIRLIGGVILSLLGEEYCYKQILIPELGLVDIWYEIHASKNDDIVLVLYAVEKIE